MENRRAWILGLSFIVGMSVAALVAGHTIRNIKRMDEFVTVKGLSEREVPADLAIWPVSFTVSANDLTELQAQIQTSRRVIAAFLVGEGFDSTEVSNAPPQINDAQTVTNDSKTAKRSLRY